MPNYPGSYAYAISDNCTCHWINYSDYGGWYLKSRDSRCPDHGWDDKRDEAPDA